MSFYNRIIPRLNGAEIVERFDYYLSLAKKGVAGFIIFGGELETVRAGIERLQKASDNSLFIASDLEQGLGQQVRGGTLFPPAMAIASALRNTSKADAASTLNKIYTAFAHEAQYAGINIILAPVLDINTNPDNPIIATRAFGEDAETVSFFGCEMIKALQKNNIIACGKHFPGHGDTETDSHISLPVINKDASSLEQNELVPFQNAINSGVRMIMLGHLSVPAIEPSGMPVSLSENAVRYLRDRMDFKGLLITDAMNMGGISGYTEEEASLMALKAGVDLILHPTDADNIASYLEQENYKPTYLNPLTPSLIPLHPPLTKGDKRGILLEKRFKYAPGFSEHKRLSEELAIQAIKIDGNFRIKKPFVLILDDENNGKGQTFMDTLRQKFRDANQISIETGKEIPWNAIPSESDLIVCVFSLVKAWKGKTSEWLKQNIAILKDKAEVIISFGNPYLLHNLKGKSAKVYAFWGSKSAQTAVARIIIEDMPFS